jgi:AraC family transcriptional regulator, activator of mtrCDE
MMSDPACTPSRIGRDAPRRPVRRAGLVLVSEQADEDSLENLLSTLEIHVGSVVLCEIGRRIRLALAPAEEIVVHYVLAGEGWLEVEGGSPVPFAPGTVLIAPRGRATTLGAGRDDETELSAETLLCRRGGLDLIDAAAGGAAAIRIVSEILSPGHAGSLGLFDNLIEPVAEDLTAVPAARSAFDLALAEWAGGRFGSRALIEALVRQCLIHALRLHYERLGAGAILFAPYRDPRLVHVAGGIIRAPGESYSIGRLATAVGMGRSVFIKKFAQCFGRSPMEFVTAVRLETAARMLLSSDLPVKTVASLAGFASRSHFSRAFRVRYGVDPSSYRETATAVLPGENGFGREGESADKLA